MNWKKIIPDFFVKPRNTVIQIVFTTIFAYVFILAYHPFGSQDWFQVNTGQFAFYAGAVVVLGMMVVIISRVIMIQIRKRWPITHSGYALMIALEILAMTGFYMMIQKVFLKDDRFWFEVYYKAILNTSLILLIPYLISWLYFAWVDKKQNLEKLMVERNADATPARFVDFGEESGEIKLTILLDDLLYLEASENYVTIHYLNHNQPERMLIRTSMKRMEEQLSGFPIFRCHRSYMVNRNRVRLIKKTKTGGVIELSTSFPISLPVSETYRDQVLRTLKN